MSANGPPITQPKRSPMTKRLAEKRKLFSINMEIAKKKRETNFVPFCAFALEVKFTITKKGQFYYITLEVAAVQLSFTSCFINE